MTPTTATFQIILSRVLDGAVSIKLGSIQVLMKVDLIQTGPGIWTSNVLQTLLQDRFKLEESRSCSESSLWSISTQSWWKINPHWLSDCVVMMNNQTWTWTRTQTQPVNQPVVVCVILVDGWVVSRRGAETEGHMMTANFLLNTQ